MSNYVDMMKRRTRNHAGLNWEDSNLHNDFVDINRMALDDKYGKVGAPLSKRRNGTGPAGRDAPAGLFGSSYSVSDISIPHFIGGVVLGWFLTDYYFKRK